MKKIIMLLACILSFSFVFSQVPLLKNKVVANQKETPPELIAAESSNEDQVNEGDFARTTTVNVDNSNIPTPTIGCILCNNAIKITVPTTSTILFYSNNTFTVSHAMTITSTPTRYVRSVRAEMGYFEYVPDAENCMACNKNSLTFGNIKSGTIGGVVGTGANTHNLTVNYSPVKLPGSFPVFLTATLPPTVNCCLGTLRICIRYIVTFDDCTVCTQTICYEKKKTGAPITAPPDVNPN